MWTVKALLLLAYTKQTLPLNWLLIKRHCIGMKGSYRRDFSIYRKEDVLFQHKIRGVSEKFKNSQGTY
jgi:hypothetical protein